MTSASRAAELRALADQIEATEELAAQAAEAKQAYINALADGDPNEIDQARQKHREASAQLNEARSAVRTGPMVGASAPGSATIRPSSVHAGLAPGEVG